MNLSVDAVGTDTKGEALRLNQSIYILQLDEAPRLYPSLDPHNSPLPQPLSNWLSTAGQAACTDSEERVMMSQLNIDPTATGSALRLSQSICNLQLEEAPRLYPRLDSFDSPLPKPSLNTLSTSAAYRSTDGVYMEAESDGKLAETSMALRSSQSVHSLQPDASPRLQTVSDHPKSPQLPESTGPSVTMVHQPPPVTKGKLKDGSIIQSLISLILCLPLGIPAVICSLMWKCTSSSKCLEAASLLNLLALPGFVLTLYVIIMTAIGTGGFSNFSSYPANVSHGFRF